MHLNYMASTFQAASIVPNLQLFSCDFLCLNLDGFGLFKKKKKYLLSTLNKSIGCELPTHNYEVRIENEFIETKAMQDIEIKKTNAIGR